MILVGVLVVALLAVGGVLNHWRNAGLWGESDAMFQMRHDPLAAKNLLGFTSCGSREDPGGLFGDRPRRITWYNPGSGDHQEIIEKVGQYAIERGWTHTGWNKNGYWIAERRLRLHRDTIQVGIGFDDLTNTTTSNDCWLRIGMHA
ncbi:hypothetical protein [Acidipropionibacterium acidipropionici]|uniref:hypothetical protein n=1 Tax=Acidipropionibacterium acidipropionici TaxID=1748 RepID=UPI000A64823E|nr:hypothetical protein [Acidipropionibacterium acidipropionici]